MQVAGRHAPGGRQPVAEGEHEALQLVVPVVVARQGVDGLAIALVRPEELLRVVVDVARGVDDVAADDHEVAVRGQPQDRRHQHPLRGVALARVAHHQHAATAVGGAAVDDQVGVRGRQLLHPRPAHVVHRIVQAGHEVVPGLPQRAQVEPLEHVPGPAGAPQPHVPAGRQVPLAGVLRPVGSLPGAVVGVHGAQALRSRGARGRPGRGRRRCARSPPAARPGRPRSAPATRRRSSRPPARASARPRSRRSRRARPAPRPPRPRRAWSGGARPPGAGRPAAPGCATAAAR